MDIGKAEKILKFWLGIEYLSPSSPPKLDAKEGCWTIKADGELPWRDSVKRKVLPETRDLTWRFVAYGGLVDMEGMVSSLQRFLGVPPGTEEEFSPGDPAAIVGINLDFSGMVVGDVMIASLPWAMGRIKAAGDGPIDLEGFEERDGFEEKLKSAILALLAGRQVISPSYAKALELDPTKVSLRALTCDDIDAAVALILEEANWHPDTPFVERARIASFKVSRKNAQEAVDGDMLNSFVAADINAVRKAVLSKNFGPGLEKYLFGIPESERRDVVQDGGVQIFAATEPKHMPLGRWPSKFPLALAQQFAVNHIMGALFSSNGLFSVNGPPGTGKTTLLRDVVAALIVERARKMAAFEDPKDAFPGKIDIRDSKFPAWRIKESICGFGMVVASSNNGAVENVTKELPTAKSIDAPGVAIDYFAAVAESVLADPKAMRRKPGTCWGLVAAVLGNKSNRTSFAQRFWFAKPPAEGDLPEDALWSLRMAWEAERDGTGWQDARQRFLEAVAKAEAAISGRQNDAEVIADLDRATGNKRRIEAKIPPIKQAISNSRAASKAASTREAAAQRAAETAGRRLTIYNDLVDAKERLDRIERQKPSKSQGELEAAFGRVEEGLTQLEQPIRSATRRLEVLRSMPPGFFQRLFNLASARAWRRDCLAETEKLEQLEAEAAALETTGRDIKASLVALSKWEYERISTERALDSAEKAVGQEFGAVLPVSGFLKATAAEASRELENKRQERARCESELLKLEKGLAELETAFAEEDARAVKCGKYLASRNIDDKWIKAWSLRSMSEEDRQRAAPWYDASLYELRHNVFVAALELHKAFIVANERAIKGNIGHFIDLMSGKLSPAAVDGGVQPLWETFFLVVPVVSTTFASVARLFVGMGRESLGWLLIDEAGQATPQAALGAVWRAKRTVVVGDPIQIEPVVPLPGAAIEALRLRNGLERMWHPVLDSAQVLADRANRFGTRIREHWVGSPLRVHRRCLNPMFKVANRIAYEGLMVYGTTLGKEEKEKTWLGDSRWFDVRGEDADKHWIPAQGKLAVELVQRIIESEGGAFTKDGKANVYVISPFRQVGRRIQRDIRPVAQEACWKIAGTVHTFQGREAAAVILLLGGNPKTPGSISRYAAAKPNLLNVALTRAQRRIYVIGDRDHWRKHQYFSDLAEMLPVETVEAAMEF